MQANTSDSFHIIFLLLLCGWAPPLYGFLPFRVALAHEFPFSLPVVFAAIFTTSYASSFALGGGANALSVFCLTVGGSLFLHKASAHTTLFFWRFLSTWLLICVFLPWRLMGDFFRRSP